MKKICVIDGQGGGIGSLIIRKLQEACGTQIEIIALGTNAIATTQMLKARANRGASGENAIKVTVSQADIIIGPLSIILANSMMGEVTPKIAEVVSTCKAKKYLLPLFQENAVIIGMPTIPLPRLVEEIVGKISLLVNEK